MTTLPSRSVRLSFDAEPLLRQILRLEELLNESFFDSYREAIARKLLQLPLINVGTLQQMTPIAGNADDDQLTLRPLLSPEVDELISAMKTASQYYHPLSRRRLHDLLGLSPEVA